MSGDLGGELNCSAVAGSLGPGSWVKWFLFLLTVPVGVSIR